MHLDNVKIVKKLPRGFELRLPSGMNRWTCTLPLWASKGIGRRWSSWVILTAIMAEMPKKVQESAISAGQDSQDLILTSLALNPC